MINMSRSIEGYGLYGSDDLQITYGPNFDVVDPKSNPVIKNDVDPITEGVPTEPGTIPEVTGNEMFSNTDFPLLI